MYHKDKEYLSMPKNNPLESDPKLAILKYLTKKGYLVWKHHKNTFNAKLGIRVSDPYIPNGMADILFIDPEAYGQLVGLEIKRPKGGRRSPDQLLMQKRFHTNNARYEFVKSVDDVKALGF